LWAPFSFEEALLGIWQRLRAWLRPGADLFNLEVEPAYAIKASVRNPYFQSLERAARDAGCLGAFIVDDQGRLRQGSRERLATRRAQLFLDVYPNPAAIEARTVADPKEPRAPRRVPRATLVLDDDSELFLWFDGGSPRVAGPGLERTP
jgi:hypothetical protein